MIELSIIIPCYNEAENLPIIADRMKTLIADKNNIEIIFVNNGSKDNSAEIFQEIVQSAKDHFKLCNVPVNRGYGFGILSGLNVASGNILAWTHADMQTDPADVLKAFELLKNENNKKCIIKGKRINRRLSEAFFTFGMQLVTYFKLKTYISDINAQPKLFHRDFYEYLLKDEAPHDFSLDLFILFTAKRNDYIIKEIPVFFTKRLHGEAKGGGSLKTRIKLIKRTLAYICALKKQINS